MDLIEEMRAMEQEYLDKIIADNPYIVDKAIKFIEETLVPLFRKAKKWSPKVSRWYITFTVDARNVVYMKSDIPKSSTTKYAVDENTLVIASSISSEYGISATTTYENESFVYNFKIRSR